MIIAVDFDGTIVEDAFPYIGCPNQDIINYLLDFQKRGCKLILWTCRNGEYLKEAVSFCNTRGLKFDAINDNLSEIKEKYDGDTRKVYADIYIDDKNVCIDSLKGVFKLLSEVQYV